MAWWTKTNAELSKTLSSREDMLSEDELGALGGVFWGADANHIKKAFPDLFHGYSLTDNPAGPGAEKAIGIGVNNSYFVLDPNSTRKGVWVLNATSEEAARNAQAASSPTQWGYYFRVSEDIPPLADLMAANLTFGKGFTDAYYRYYPAQDTRPKAKAKAPTTPAIAVKTYEMVGTINGQTVPLTEVVRYLSGSDYELAEGADIAVADSPDDGFGLAGNPGKWAEYYQTASPAQYGLDRDKAVMFWNGTKGEVLPGAVLRDWFGPNWRASVY